jgi:hypothetical protein
MRTCVARGSSVAPLRRCCGAALRARAAAAAAASPRCTAPVAPTSCAGADSGTPPARAARAGPCLAQLLLKARRGAAAGGGERRGGRTAQTPPSQQSAPAPPSLRRAAGQAARAAGASCVCARAGARVRAGRGSRPGSRRGGRAAATLGRQRAARPAAAMTTLDLITRAEFIVKKCAAREPHRAARARPGRDCAFRSPRSARAPLAPRLAPRGAAHPARARHAPARARAAPRRRPRAAAPRPARRAAHARPAPRARACAPRPAPAPAPRAPRRAAADTRSTPRMRTRSGWPTRATRSARCAWTLRCKSRHSWRRVLPLRCGCASGPARCATRRSGAVPWQGPRARAPAPARAACARPALPAGA